MDEDPVEVGLGPSLTRQNEERTSREMPDSVEGVAYQRDRVPTVNTFDDHDGLLVDLNDSCLQGAGNRGVNVDGVKKNVAFVQDLSFRSRRESRM